MIQGNPYDMYKRQAVSTMSPGELIVLLFEEASLSINKALIYIEKKDIENSHNNIIKAENIVMYLKDCLDMSYPISKNLSSLYQFMYEELIKANFSKDPEILKNVLNMITEFKDTWKEAEVKSHSSLNSGNKI